MTDTVLTTQNNTTVIAEQQTTNVVAEGSKQPSVVVTGVMGPPGTSNITMDKIRDLDLTELGSGSLLVYNPIIAKWVATTLLDQQTFESGQY
jgi:hypothetical protein